MRILFGAENDGLHISPDEPNGYEWWYFDAISDDQKYILVIIYFLGTPMSPYYKAVVDGKNPLPSDWCGVFVTLHEWIGGKYQERAYAYNLYRGAAFSDAESTVDLFTRIFQVGIGNSRMEQGVVESDGQKVWNLRVHEPGLWWGTVHADLSFEATPALVSGLEPGEGSSSHNWVCVAPDCRVIGDVSFGGKTVRFNGRGYHDHNFGQLPWSEMQFWKWNRVHFSPDNTLRGVVHYAWLSNGGSTHFLATWDKQGVIRRSTVAFDKEEGLQEEFQNLRRKRPIAPRSLAAVANVGLRSFHTYVPISGTDLQAALFYARYPIGTETLFPDGHTEIPIGVGEWFHPEGLCGPIISRAMWTRIRRRS